jgi:hypothetical protein
VGFLRIPQIVNPDRLSSPYEEFLGLGDPPDTGVAIGSQSVCFVIKTEVEGVAYSRYCSVPDSILSVRSIFESQFAELQELISQVADGFGLPIDVEDTISEMEDIENLKTCAAATPTSQEGTPTAEPQEGLQEACDSDITVAPVTRAHFEEQLRELNILETPTSNRFVFTSLSEPVFQESPPTPVEVAVVLIHENIETSLGLVMPGKYTMQYWFDENDVFYAATITGVTLDEQGNEIGQVVNQQVPAVPAGFVNDPDEPPPDPDSEPGALISACRIFGYCSFFQWSCT